METKEVLRQWLAGTGNKRIAARVGIDVKTVRRYVNAAHALGLKREQGAAALTEELLTTLLASLQGRPGRQRGESDLPLPSSTSGARRRYASTYAHAALAARVLRCGREAAAKAAAGRALRHPALVRPKVGRDHLAQVDKALYSLPTRFIGKRLRARADSALVRFYDHGTLVKTHPRKPPGDGSIDESDFPAHKSAYALRDVAFLERQAAEHGDTTDGGHS